MGDVGTFKLYEGMVIYFIQAGETGDIKIGFTAAKSPEKRMKTFQTGHFAKLRLLGTIPGTIKDEQSIHRELRHLRTTGEWFRSSIILLATIQKMIVGQLPWYHIRDVKNDLLEEEWHSKIVIPTRYIDQSSYWDYPVEYPDPKKISDLLKIEQKMRDISKACTDGLIDREQRNKQMRKLSMARSKLGLTLPSFCWHSFAFQNERNHSGTTLAV